MGVLYLELDTVRTSRAEPSFNFVSGADRMSVNTNDAGRLQKWATGSITLRPVNTSPDFADTQKYESCKYRLSQTSYNSDYWEEHAERYYDSAGNVVAGGFDFWIHCKQPAKDVYDPVNTGNFFITQIANLAIYSISLDKYNEQLASDVTLPVMYSQNQLPANQGFVLKFAVHERGSINFGSALAFFFGDYLIDFAVSGKFQLSQSPDGFNTVYSVGAGTWCDPDSVVGNYHTITIYPHHRNVIEITSTTRIESRFQTVRSAFRLSGPAEVPFHTESTTNTFTVKVAPSGGVITQPGPWAITVNRKYMPIFQVSTLCFYNGTAVPAELYDTPHDLGYAPANVQGSTVTPRLNYDYDSNGCQLYGAVFDGNNIAPPWQPGSFQPGVTQAICAGFKWVGVGDMTSGVQNVANFSSKSPELYSYAIYKDARMIYSGNPVTSLVKSFKIDSGSSPENESAVITINAEPGSPGENYTNRGEIDVLMYDDVEGNLFEGTAHEVEYRNSAGEPIELVLTCRGRVDSLLTNDPVDLDFTEDASNPGYAWYWQNALRACFEVGGFTAGSIQFLAKGQDGGAYNFPFWRELEAGGSNGGGAVDGKNASQGRWKPIPDKPIHEFIDGIVRRLFGWHWAWSKSGRNWQVYQRPKPSAEDAEKTPVAAFFGSVAAMNDWLAQTGSEVPCYTYTSRRFKTIRPTYSTLKCYARFPVYGLKSADQLQALSQSAANGTDIDTPAYETQDQLNTIFAENPNAYPKVQGQAMNTNHPDYIGKPRSKVVVPKLACNWTMFAWIVRRFYEDLCFGQRSIEFRSDWGDFTTANLKKWDLVLVDPDPAAYGSSTSGFHYFDRYESEGGGGSAVTPDGVTGPAMLQYKNRRANYTAYQYRSDAPPPR